MSHDLPATRESARPAPRAATPPAPARTGPLAPAASRTPPASRWGRRLLGAALLVAALGFGSCHAFWMALLG